MRGIRIGGIMAKIGILNFPGHNNQGANLTAYALQKLLKNWGHRAVNLHLLDNYAQWKKNQYTDFSDEHIEMTTYAAAGMECMKRYNRDFDTFIVGSDQVWRPGVGRIFGWKEKFDSCFWLAFAEPGKRRISVAASLGSSDMELPERQLNRFREELKRYAAISVREHTSVPVIRDIDGREPALLVDPVFYLQKDEWERLATPREQNPNAGAVGYNSFYHAGVISEIREKLPAGKTIFNLLEGTTAQWLAGVRDAAFVITDSFHVTCFCLIFGTPFVCLTNPTQGPSRFYGLQESFQFSPRRILNTEDAGEVLARVQELIDVPFERETVDAAVARQREHACNWLRQALDAPVPEWTGSPYAKRSLAKVLAECRNSAQWRRRTKRQALRRAFGFLLHVSPIGRQWLKGKHERQIKILQDLPW